MADIEEILEFVLGHCAAYRLPDQWARFKAPADFFKVPSDSAVLLAALQERFSQEELYMSRVVAASEDGRQILHPGLSDPQTMVAGLRTALGKKPFDVLTHLGCIAACRLPVCAALEDRRYAGARPDQKNQLFVGFSLADMAVLSLLRLPATIANGLSGLGRDPLGEFCKCFQLGRRGSGASIDGIRPSLVLVGWSPSQFTLEEPEGFTAVLNHLLGLQQHLQIELEDVGVWQPSPDELERLHFSLGYGDGRDVCEAAASSVDSSTRDMRWLLNHEHEQRMNYTRAVEQWSGAVRSCGDRQRQEQAWKQLQQLEERDLIIPILRHAESTRDPIERGMVVAVANVSRILHPLALRLAADFANANRKNDPQASLLLPQEEFAQFLALTDRLRALIQELQPCRRQKTPTVTRKLQSPNLSSTDWDLPRKRLPR